MSHPARRIGTITIAAANLVILVVLAESVGSVTVDPQDVWSIVAHRALPGSRQRTWTAAEEHIVWNLRMPRVLLAALAGASLSTAGATLQAITRNPLADPFLFGVSSGAALFAVAALTGTIAPLAGLSLPAAAFLGALVITFAVFMLAASRGRVDMLRLVLSGVAVAQICSALTTLLLLRISGRDSAITSILTWLAGSLAGATWGGLTAPLIATALGLFTLVALASRLNAVALGDDTATAVGVDVARLRIAVFVITSLLVGVVVSRSGAIGFVGLVIPHAVRRVVGSDYRKVLPWAAYCGACLMIIVDLIGRVAISPNEIPVGVVTALFGGPFFLWLLRRRTQQIT